MQCIRCHGNAQNLRTAASLQVAIVAMTTSSGVNIGFLAKHADWQVRLRSVEEFWPAGTHEAWRVKEVRGVWFMLLLTLWQQDVGFVSRNIFHARFYTCDTDVPIIMPEGAAGEIEVHHDISTCLPLWWSPCGCGVMRHQTYHWSYLV
jgi:hypothetical protein